MIDFSDEMRQQLGIGAPSFEVGSWWCVPHKAVTHHEVGSFGGQPFAKKGDPGDGRRVVLGSAFGPNATLYPRSSSVKTTFEHPRHAHAKYDHRCRLTDHGWINFRQPVSVEIGCLTMEFFSCEEPEGSTVFVRIDEARAL